MGATNKEISIFDYLKIDHVLFLDAESRDEALNKLTDLLQTSGALRDKETFHDAIMHRERIVSTGIGMGVAIPHAKLEEYDDFFLALGIQPEVGIEWDAIDGAPVRLIFMIGGPDQKQTEYLGILSQLTSLIKDDLLRTRLLKANSHEEVLALLKQALAK